nr:uncharacterized protein LOC109417227 [Aedes albopictus]
MDDTRPMPQFRCEDIAKARLHHEWKDWKSGLERYFDANDITDQYKKRAKLLYLGGPQLDKVFTNLPDGNKFPLVATEKRFYDVAIAALDNYFQPVKQDILERRRLRQMKQLPGEKFSHYMVRLRQQAALCGFDKYPKSTQRVLTEMMITDVIVEGCLSVELRRRMLLKDRTLDEIEEIATGLEGVDSQIQDLAGKSNDLQDGAKMYRVRDRSSQGFRRPPLHTSRTDMGRYRGRQLPRSNIVCFNCGRSGHIATSDSCPAKGKQCRNCKRMGHFDYTCKSPRGSVNQTQPSPPSKKIRVVEQQEACGPDEGKVYYAFFNGNQSNMLTFEVGGVPLAMLVDSGADANLVTFEAWEKLKQAGVRVASSTRESDRSFFSYGSTSPLVLSKRHSKESCFSCGQSGHFSSSPDCPARGRTCRRCQQLGHFEVVCKKRKSSIRKPGDSKRIHTIDETSATFKNSDEEIKSATDEKVYYAFYGGNVSNVQEATIGDNRINVLIDSGADANLIRLETWEMLKAKKGYGCEKPLDVVGTFEAEVIIGRRSTIAEFFVVRGGQKDIIGRE